MAAGGYSGDEKFFAMLELPARAYEIQDALQKLRITANRAVNLRMEVCSCEILPELTDVRLDSPSIEEMNFLAQRLGQLSDIETISLRGVWKRLEKECLLEEPVRAMDLINMTHGLETVMIASNVSNDYELGEFVLNGDLDDDLIQLSDKTVEMLDMEAVGRWHRANQAGEFVGSHYVVAGEYQLQQIYDGIHLPAQEQEKPFVFRLQVAESPVNDSMENLSTAEWISLPIDRDEADRIARKHNERCIEDCFYYGFESAIPQITAEHYGDMLSFVRLNRLAAEIARMKPSEQVKLKAVLEHEKPDTLETVQEVVDHLGEYQLDNRIGDADSYFKEYLLRHLDTRFDARWLDRLAVCAEGTNLMQRLGAAETDYGIVSARRGQLYALVPFEQEQEYGLSEKMIGNTDQFTEPVIVAQDENAEIECRDFREYVKTMSEFDRAEYAVIPEDTNHFANALVNSGFSASKLMDMRSEWKFDDIGYQYFEFPNAEDMLTGLKERYPQNTDIFERTYQSAQCEMKQEQGQTGQTMTMGGF